MLAALMNDMDWNIANLCVDAKKKMRSASFAFKTGHLQGIHEDLSTELAPQLRKKTILELP